MNPDVKKKWTCALRSGEYTQGHHALKKRDAFGKTKHCCLGVLVDLYIKEKEDEADIEWEKPAKKSTFIGAVPKNGENENPLVSQDYLPEEVVAWAGLEGINPAVHVNEDERAALSLLNDGEEIHFGDWSFGDIADAIEQSL